jgi:hypothetical protein
MSFLVSLIGHESLEIYLLEVLGFPEGPCIQHCPKVPPFHVLHNSQLALPIEVILIILESSQNEFLLAYHFNLVAPNLNG